jgi:hypothetical protein
MNYYTQPQTIQLRHNVCPDQGVYLRWLSPLGNWEGWHFTGDVDTTVSVENATSFRPVPGRSTVALKRQGVSTQLVRAGNLTTDQHAALTTLLDSPQVYRQYYDGRREPVYVYPSTRAQRSSSATRHTFEVEIETSRRNSLTH